MRRFPMTSNRSQPTSRSGLDVSHRRGLTFLEILIASAIMAGALAPIVQSFYTLIVGFAKTSDSTHGAFLAQAVMENIRYRLYNFDARFYGVNATEEARIERVGTGAWKHFFQELAESEGARCVVEMPAGTSRYFLEFERLQGSTLHPVSEQSNPALWRALAATRCFQLRAARLPSEAGRARSQPQAYRGATPPMRACARRRALGA